ncbi:flavodoxin domain-containing protein [Marinospirillum sp. MEB164]|uniref:Flavodoxin domain-containing protein n=1 Tax=Marinospirillum alkalitolerans TaxID=3123374 RepID=A0ABW8PW87_9GAMM
MKVYLAVGSVYGGAAEVAEEYQRALSEAGLAAELDEAPRVERLGAEDILLVVTSTTGQGELPDAIQPFFQQLESQAMQLSGRPFAVVALGDSSYGASFAAAGRAFQHKLEDLGAQAIQPLLVIDALEHFQAVDGAQVAIQSLVEALTR